jgi:predicted regulator of Ras-like GTPase activity (Roadblock/LC7/MglB family)
MLEEPLKNAAAAVEGAVSVHLIAMDGMTVASVTRDGAAEVPLDLVAASYADVCKKVASAHREAEWTSPVELMVTAESFSVLFRTVGPEYGLLAILRPDGSLGRARFELLKAADALRDELS